MLLYIQSPVDILPLNRKLPFFIGFTDRLKATLPPTVSVYITSCYSLVRCLEWVKVTHSSTNLNDVILLVLFFCSGFMAMTEEIAPPAVNSFGHNSRVFINITAFLCQSRICLTGTRMWISLEESFSDWKQNSTNIHLFSFSFIEPNSQEIIRY